MVRLAHLVDGHRSGRVAESLATQPTPMVTGGPAVADPVEPTARVYTGLVDDDMSRVVGAYVEREAALALVGLRPGDEAALSGDLPEQREQVSRTCFPGPTKSVSTALDDTEQRCNRRHLT
jgi:hypothetical protein